MSVCWQSFVLRIYCLALYCLFMSTIERSIFTVELALFRSLLARFMN